MQTNTKTGWLAMTAVMAAVLAVLSPISIPVGFIPITLAVFAVYLTGTVLPTSAAMASIAVYLLLGGIGLPIFSNYRGGPQMLVGPTGGYLFGYFIIVFVVSQTVQRTNRLVLQMLLGALALAMFYLLGTMWYVMVTKSSFLSGLAVCVAPFVVPDLLKMVAALSLGALLKKRLGKARGA